VGRKKEHLEITYEDGYTKKIHPHQMRNPPKRGFFCGEKKHGGIVEVMVYEKVGLAR